MTISLTPDMEASIQRQLDMGRYQSSEEVVARALSALELYELVPYSDAGMRAELAEKLADPDSQEFIEGDVIEAELDAWAKTLTSERH